MGSSSISGYLYVLAAGSLWATTGSFAKVLYAQELSSLQVAFIRALLTFLFLTAFLLLRKKGYFRVAARDLLLLAVVGLMGISMFAVFYFYTIQVTSITQAVFLLYSAPIFATIMARLIFKEPLSKVKVAALVSSITGVMLLTKIYDPANLTMPLAGILTGLGAAVTFALSIIAGKSVLTRYSAWTVQFYSFAFGLLFLAFLAHPSADIANLKLVNWLVLTMMALVTTFGAFACFFAGLKRVEASRASIVASIEPVVASFLGFALFSESLGPPEMVGSVLILLGAILVQF